MLGGKLFELLFISIHLGDQRLLTLQRQSSQVFASLLHGLCRLLLQSIHLCLDLGLEHFDVLFVLHNGYQALAKLLKLFELLCIAVVKHLIGIFGFLQRVLNLHVAYKF